MYFFLNIDNVPTPPGIIPSNRNNSNSPPQSATLGEIFPFLGEVFTTNGTETPIDCFGNTVSNNDDSENLLSICDIINNIPSGLEDEKLRIIAEPKAFYRERYSCETDPTKNRAQRYIRTEDNNNQYEYPTVKVFRIYFIFLH